MKMQQQHDNNNSLQQDESAGVTCTQKISNNNFQPKHPCSVRIKKSSSFRIRGIPHNWTTSTTTSSSAASAASTVTTATTSIGASSAASTVSLDSISSLFRLGHSTSTSNNNNSPAKIKQHKKSISSKLGGENSSRTISPLRKLFHLGGSNNKDSSNVIKSNEQNCTSTSNSTAIEGCDRTCSEVSLSPKPEKQNIVQNHESTYDETIVEGCAEEQKPMLDFADFTVHTPLHMQPQHHQQVENNETNDDDNDDDDDDLSLENDSPQVGILTKISEEVSVSTDSIEVSKNEVWNRRLGSERKTGSDDKKLVFNNVIYPPKGEILTDILYLNSTSGPCDIDAVLDDEMDDLECRLTSRKQFLNTKQEQEQQEQLSLTVESKEEEKQKVTSLRKLIRTGSTIGGTSRAKLLRSETASSLLSTTSIRTGISSAYDTSDTFSDAGTFTSADTGSMSLNIVGSDGIFGASSCDSYLNVEKDCNRKQQHQQQQATTSVGPVDVDDFIPKDSMYFEEDYGDWFILDEVEISRGLAGYEIGFEPETIWSVNLDDISISSNCRISTKKSTRGTKTNTSTTSNTNKPSIPTNSKARLLSTTRKPKLARARSNIV